MSPIVVVGASLAGLSAVDALRSGGHDGDVVVLDAATELPSDRPPLSKQVLAGTMEPTAAHQPLAGRLDDLGVDLRLGTPVAAFDAGALRLDLADGSALSASGVVVATGATPRALPGPSLGGVHVLRTLDDDALRMRRDEVVHAHAARDRGLPAQALPPLQDGTHRLCGALQELPQGFVAISAWP